MGWRKRPLSIDTWVDIEVTDANDKPSLKATLDASVDESSETTFVALTVVDELKVTEKDVETKWNTIDFKFSSGSSDDFSLVPSGTGSSKKWALNTKKAFDYETTKSVKVKVYAQDNDGAASRSKDMEITVTYYASTGFESTALSLPALASGGRYA